MADRWRPSVTIGLKECDEIKSQRLEQPNTCRSSNWQSALRMGKKLWTRDGRSSIMKALILDDPEIREDGVR